METSSDGLAEMLSRLQSGGANPFTLLMPDAGAIPVTALRRQRSSSQESAQGDESTKNVSAEEKREGEEKLARVYESFDFDALWTRLSEALTRLRRDPGSAQVLLPMIESLMVVSQHVMGTYAPEDAPLESVTSAPGTRRAQMEADFLVFTEKHLSLIHI